jgi:hypothetical protein
MPSETLRPDVILLDLCPQQEQSAFVNGIRSAHPESRIREDSTSAVIFVSTRAGVADGLKDATFADFHTRRRTGKESSPPAPSSFTEIATHATRKGKETLPVGPDDTREREVVEPR